jgi:hypothetical protein
MAPSARLAVTVALVLLAAGCLSGGPGGDVGTTPTPDGPNTETVTTTATPTQSPGAAVSRECPPPETGTATATPDAGTVRGSGTPTATVPDFEFSPDSETPVLLRNDWNRRVEVRVRVVCEPTGVTVHDEAYVLDPGTRLEAYDLAGATPDGRVPLRVVVTARNATGSVTVRTTECADVTGQILEDGGFDVWATC